MIKTCLPIVLLCATACCQTLPASAPADRLQAWAPWTKNSTQPPPVFEDVKLPPTTTQPGDGQTELIHRAAVAWFDQAIADVDKMVPAAEAVADVLINGGKLYVGGSQGFVDECVGRAGGYIFLKRWEGQALGSRDVLIVGQLNPREDGLPSAANIALGYGNLTRGRVVHIAGHDWGLMRALLPNIRQKAWQDRLTLIDTHAPTGSSWADIAVGQMATCAMGWAFQGEVFAAATRKGKTLTTYASYCEPKGHEWEKEFHDTTIHPRFSAEPMPAGQVGREYLRTCRRQIAKFLEAGQGDQVRLASRRMVDVLDAGGTVWTIIAGHVHTQGAIVPRELDLAFFGRDYDFHKKLLSKGDMLLYVAYIDYPEELVTAALAARAQAVTISVSDGPTDDSRVNIRSYWSKWDSTINVPNYPVRILPSSGVVQIPQWYSLMAEAQRIAKASPRPATRPTTQATKPD